MRRGFTLLELLVVIAIIGVLSSVVLASVNSARVKSRDALRLQHIQQIKNALELYRSANGAYPTTPGFSVAPPAPNGAWRNSNDASWNALAASLAPYITLPHDPKEDPYVNANSYPGWGFNSYLYYSSINTTNGCTGGQYYILVFRTEGNILPSPGVKMCDGTTFNFGGSGQSVVTGVSQY